MPQLAKQQEAGKNTKSAIFILMMALYVVKLVAKIVDWQMTGPIDHIFVVMVLILH